MLRSLFVQVQNQSSGRKSTLVLVPGAGLFFSKHTEINANRRTRVLKALLGSSWQWLHAGARLVAAPLAAAPASTGVSSAVPTASFYRDRPPCDDNRPPGSANRTLPERGRAHTLTTNRGARRCPVPPRGTRAPLTSSTRSSSEPEPPEDSVSEPDSDSEPGSGAGGWARARRLGGVAMAGRRRRCGAGRRRAVLGMGLAEVGRGRGWGWCVGGVVWGD